MCCKHFYCYFTKNRKHKMIRFDLYAINNFFYLAVIFNRMFYRPVGSELLLFSCCCFVINFFIDFSVFCKFNNNFDLLFYNFKLSSLNAFNAWHNLITIQFNIVCKYLGSLFCNFLFLFLILEKKFFFMLINTPCKRIK